MAYTLRFLGSLLPHTLPFTVWLDSFVILGFQFPCHFLPMCRQSQLHSVPWKWYYFYIILSFTYFFLNPGIHASFIFVFANSNPYFSTHSSWYCLWDTFMPSRYISCSSLSIFDNFYVFCHYSIVAQSILPFCSSLCLEHYLSVWFHSLLCSGFCSDVTS